MGRLRLVGWKINYMKSMACGKLWARLAAVDHCAASKVERSLT